MTRSAHSPRDNNREELPDTHLLLLSLVPTRVLALPNPTNPRNSWIPTRIVEGRQASCSGPEPLSQQYPWSSFQAQKSKKPWAQATQEGSTAEASRDI